ncbi:MAG TPA: hypothetical protein VF474_01365 [Phenylobacterium sp.]
MSPAYQAIRDAMLALQPVSFVYAGHPRQVCVHALGLNKSGREQALVFQFGGSSSSGLPTGGEWRCMTIGNIQGVQIAGGGWHTRNDHEETQTCVADVDVEIWVDVYGKPYVKRA